MILPQRMPRPNRASWARTLTQLSGSVTHQAHCAFPAYVYRKGGLLSCLGSLRQVPDAGIIAALAEFERELISERTVAGLASARARGRKGGRPYKMTPAKLRLAAASMGKPDTLVGDLCRELGVTGSSG